MVQAELRRLAERGAGAYPPDRFEALAAACREAGRSSPRLLVVAETIELLTEAWEPVEALRVETVELLDVVLAADLPAVINEPDEAAALSLANAMREAVALVLLNAPPM